MDILSIIRHKRDGKILTTEEINFFIENYTNGNIKDYQASALLMAIYINGINDREATDLAIAMKNSGDSMDLSVIKGLKVDKHSTGGVGDKVSLVLAPLVASCGLKFAKMSGRGLGHTGGTIDKLEAIDGFNTTLSSDDFIKQVNDIGVAIIGQSANITPADKKLYALRDVTETVSNVGLIAASIMSKKLAAGSDIIILDVKYGKGAFMKTINDASRLAKLMVQIGNNAGRKVEAIITSMEEPLGHKIGNALEIYEAMETLQNKGPQDLKEVVLTIASEQLLLANMVKTEKEARTLLEEKLNNGEALNKFKAFITAQGGKEEQINNPELLIGKFVSPYLAREDGYIAEFETEEIGNICRILGAGRLTMADQIDPLVGIDLAKKIGDKVKKGEPILNIYHKEGFNLSEVEKLLDQAIKIKAKAKKATLIAKIIK